MLNDYALIARWRHEEVKDELLSLGANRNRAMRYAGYRTGLWWANRDVVRIGNEEALLQRDSELRVSGGFGGPGAVPCRRRFTSHKKYYVNLLPCHDKRGRRTKSPEQSTFKVHSGQ
jgi:hypothetical protein